MMMIGENIETATSCHISSEKKECIIQVHKTPTEITTKEGKTKDDT